jgi:hypothetical protein
VRAEEAGGRYRVGRIGGLLLGLAVSACAGTGQIANLAETPRATIALEAIDGPPPAVVHRFVTALADEAAAHRIAMVAPNEASYRLRGSLAPRGEDGSAGAAAIVWSLDAYDADGRQVVRLSGEERVAARGWAAPDDGALDRIAHTGMERLAAALAGARSPAAPVIAASPPDPATPSALGWLDDWTPEASGIFRIFRRSPTRTELASDTHARARPEEVPLPRRRPAS